MDISADDFFHDFRQDLLAGAESNSEFQLAEFMENVSGELVDTGFVEGFEFCHYRAQRGMRVDGYWFNDEGGLDLFIADFDCRDELASLTKTDVEAAFRRISSFFEASLERALYAELEVTSPEYGLSRQIADRRGLAAPRVVARLDMQAGQFPTVESSNLLEIFWSSFAPQELGIIDYHGPHRLFGREHLANINVDLNAIKEQRKNSSLYNYNNKYSNVKSEMAGLYVREAISKQADGAFTENISVTATLKELFETFFPDKEFLGPKPTSDGSLVFPVRVGGREEHDLDELSSGEKEILYGYLRLRNSAPRYSVILLDEPELHLNPSLTRRLPDFYHKHLAIAQNNQIWLITHSDAMLRESVGNADYSVFHMAPSAYRDEGENQAKPISVSQDLDRAILDLVGDLASYNPGGRIVIFEGADDSEFDVRMTTELFPRFAAKVNCISGSNRKRVRGLYAALEKMSESGVIPVRVFAVVDTDADIGQVAGASELRWDVYHIENYLLNSEVVASVMNDLRGPGSHLTASDAETMLGAAAQETLNALVVHLAQSELNNAAVSALSIRVSAQSVDVAGDLTASLVASMARLVDLQAGPMSEQSLRALVEDLTAKHEASVHDGTWRTTFRGRDILKKLVATHGAGFGYEQFRNLLLAKTRQLGIEPPGMKAVLDKILAAK